MGRVREFAAVGCRRSDSGLGRGALAIACPRSNWESSA